MRVLVTGALGMLGKELVGFLKSRSSVSEIVERDIDDLPIEEICQRDVLKVSPLTGVDEAARRMLERRVGSAMVVDGRYVVGIFTTTDALKLLGELFGKSSSHKK